MTKFRPPKSINTLYDEVPSQAGYQNTSEDGEQLIQVILFFINLLLIACGIASNLSIIVMTRYFPSCHCFQIFSCEDFNFNRLRNWIKNQYRNRFKPERILLESIVKSPKIEEQNRNKIETELETEIKFKSGVVSPHRYADSNYNSNMGSNLGSNLGINETIITPTTCESFSPNGVVDLHTASQTQLQMSRVQIPESSKLLLSPSCQSSRAGAMSPASHSTAPLLQDQRHSTPINGHQVYTPSLTNTVRLKIFARLRNLVIFEVFGVKFSAKKSIFQNCAKK